jgi:dolichol-phosphate mannosyltransferase
MHINKKIGIVLPALDPDDKILKFIDSLIRNLGNKLELIVVNDGSKLEKRTEFFDKITQLSGCTVLHHEINLGKGAALKTAFSYLLNRYQNSDDFIGCVTADCDGQHSVKDVIRCMDLLQDNPDKLILGCREFQQKDVPWKSRFGNNLTLFIFNKILKISVDDTQTGLRGLGKNIMQYSLEIPGNRFEFETDMLLISKIKKFDIISYVIDTIYFEANSGTHFRPIKDGLKIYWRILRVLFWQFITFAISSLSAAILDIGIFSLCFYTIFTQDMTLSIANKFEINSRILYSCVLARVISSIWNFIINRRLVFKSHGNGHKALGKEIIKYYSLAIIVFILSWIMTDLIDNTIPEKFIYLAKATIDTLIFVLIFYIQKLFIFKKH